MALGVQTHAGGVTGKQSEQLQMDSEREGAGTCQTAVCGADDERSCSRAEKLVAVEILGKVLMKA